MKQIIEKLASKELNFGCEIQYNDVKAKLLGKEDNMFHYFCEKGFTGCGYLREEEFNVLGHPVYIGDVLEWVDKKFSDDINDDSKSDAIMDLIAYWSQCGLSRSLQQIEEGSGYEVYTFPNANAPDGKALGKRLKDPHARALAEFLNNLI